MSLVLLIEDDVKTARLVEKVLVGEDFKVVHAATGLDGLRHARAMIHDVDLILVDMDLPDLEGKVIVVQLRGIFSGRKIPVVAFTAHDDARARRLALAVGCDDYLVKPIDTRTFAATIKGFIQPSDQPVSTAPHTPQPDAT